MEPASFDSLTEPGGGHIREQQARKPCCDDGFLSQSHLCNFRRAKAWTLMVDRSSVCSPQTDWLTEADLLTSESQLPKTLPKVRSATRLPRLPFITELSCQHFEEGGGGVLGETRGWDKPQSRAFSLNKVLSVSHSESSPPHWQNKQMLGFMWAQTLKAHFLIWKEQLEHYNIHGEAVFPGCNLCNNFHKST